MAKNIVVLSDGTGNSAAKANKTNVWRLYKALEKSRPEEQVVYYDDGVGTEGGFFRRTLGGAIGLGFRQNVIELYDFVSRSYEEGDKIYLFGFSRGAFTVRFLAGLIARIGVIRLDLTASPAAWRQEARRGYYTHRSGFGRSFAALLCPWTRTPPTEVIPTDIEFVGVWDTVDAYGFPNDYVARLWDKLVFRIYFPNYRLSEKVKKGRQALAIDDERHTFHPLLWDESEETGDRIEQVWFTGMHADVGGGYFRNGLAHVSLLWMIDEVIRPPDGADGLILVEADCLRMRAEATPYDMMHNSRLGLKSFYRYAPRLVSDLSIENASAEDRVIVTRPKIHRSVFERIRDPLAPYAPVGLPGEYDVWPPADDLADDAFETEDERMARMKDAEGLLKLIAFRRFLYVPLVLFWPAAALAAYGLWRPLEGPASVDQASAGVLAMACAWFWHALDVVLHNWPIFLGVAVVGIALRTLQNRVSKKSDAMANDMWRRLKAKAVSGAATEGRSAKA